MTDIRQIDTRLSGIDPLKNKEYERRDKSKFIGRNGDGQECIELTQVLQIHAGFVPEEQARALIVAYLVNDTVGQQSIAIVHAVFNHLPISNVKFKSHPPYSDGR